MRASAYAGVVVAAVLVACSDAPSPPEQPLPARPEVPDDWRIVTTDEEDVVLAIPRELIATGTTGAIVAVEEDEGGVGRREVWVIGPGTLELRPRQTTDEWVEASMWLTGQQEGAVLGAVSRDPVALPAGPAIEMTASYTVDGRESWTILYVIDTSPGFAVFRAGGAGPPPDGLPDEIALIRDLATFPTP